ncbi:hypothetical protein RFI_17502, partial [Reticulomyxa filosa]
MSRLYPEKFSLIFEGNYIYYNVIHSLDFVAVTAQNKFGYAAEEIGRREVAFKNRKKTMEMEKNKIERQEKMLRVQQIAAARSPPRAQKVDNELNEWKKRYEAKSKQAREEKLRADELENE